MRIAVVLLFSTLVREALSQAPPLRTLAKPDAELPVAFTKIQSIRELPDGRVIITDWRENTIHVGNFATSKATQVSGRGSGPREYGRAWSLFPFAGDTSMMFDPANARFLLFTPAGQPARTFTAGERSTSSLIDARGVDTQGRFYSTSIEEELAPVVMMPRPGQILRGNRDSTSIVRFPRIGRSVETIARIRVTPVEAVGVNPTQMGDAMVMGARNLNVPFAPHDDWAVFPDGRVAVVRSKDYHVDFYRDGKRSSGPPTPYTPVPVTTADKDEARVARRPPSGGAAPDPSVWLTVKPPFGENSAWAAPNGELWVEVSRRAGDAVPRFDVFDSVGVRRYAVTLPAGSRIIGFGKQAVYVVRTDADDLQYLRRFNLK
jgi:hypothetical protein